MKILALTKSIKIFLSLEKIRFFFFLINSFSFCLNNLLFFYLYLNLFYWFQIWKRTRYYFEYYCFDILSINFKWLWRNSLNPTINFSNVILHSWLHTKKHLKFWILHLNSIKFDVKLFQRFRFARST